MAKWGNGFEGFQTADLEEIEELGVQARLDDLERRMTHYEEVGNKIAKMVAAITERVETLAIYADAVREQCDGGPRQSPSQRSDLAAP